MGKTGVVTLAVLIVLAAIPAAAAAQGGGPYQLGPAPPGQRGDRPGYQGRGEIPPSVAPAPPSGGPAPQPAPAPVPPATRPDNRGSSGDRWRHSPGGRPDWRSPAWGPGPWGYDRPYPMYPYYRYDYYYPPPPPVWVPGQWVWNGWQWVWQPGYWRY